MGRATHSAASASARSAVRLAITKAAGPASSSEGITPLTAPPAPSTKIRAPSKVQPAFVVTSVSRPFPSVLSAWIPPASFSVRKLAAPVRRALSDTVSASSQARVLKGRVTFRPRPSVSKKAETQLSKSSTSTRSAR